MSSIAIAHASPAAPLTGTVTTAQIFALASNPNMPATIAVPGKGRLDGKRFTIRAEGSAFVAAGTTTVNATLFAATGAIPASPLVPGSWTLIKALTATAIATAVYAPWWIEAQLIYDSNGGAMQGAALGLINNASIASAAITQLTGINGTNLPVSQAGTVVQPADPVAYFAVGITFGTSGANIANLANFELGF